MGETALGFLLATWNLYFPTGYKLVRSFYLNKAYQLVGSLGSTRRK